MKKRLVVFHPAIAPYRIDFFNTLAKEFEASFYFESKEALEQSFDQRLLGERLSFAPRYLKPGWGGIKNLRTDVWAILGRHKPDLVFISEYNILGILVLLYKFLVCPALRVVITCDDNLDMARSAGRVKRATRSLLLRHVYATLLVNTEVRDWYERRLPYGARYIYFPIIQSDTLFRQRLTAALPRTESLRQSYGLGDRKVFLYVGRLVEVKNVSLLARSFAEIHKTYPDTALFIVGDGHLRDDLRAEVRELGLERSAFLPGKKEGLELMAYYNLGDIFVLPSTYEPFGTVVNEALLAGCYVLCSSGAGAACLVEDGHNGFRFDARRTDGLVQAAKALLEARTNVPDKGNKMLFSYQEMIDTVLRILKE